MKHSIETPISQIDPNPYQPRVEFPEKAQRELQESIEKNGLIQPIVIRQVNDRYQILAGERRLKAFRNLGYPTIPAIVKMYSDEEMRVLSLIENVQREELSAIEIAKSYRALIEDLGYTQDRIASQLGKERSTVANQMRLLGLPIEIQEDISKRRLSAGHARALLPLKESKKIFSLRDEILKKNLSVRDVEKRAKKLLKPGNGKAHAPSEVQTKDPNVRALEEQLCTRLNTRVEIWGDNEGSIQIAYDNVQEFNRIFNAIMESESDEDDF